jgi:hypothetical protein
MWRFGIVFLISAAAVAQNATPKATSSYQIGDPRLNATMDLGGDFQNHQALQGSANHVVHRPLRHYEAAAPPADRVCYTMRSYIFKREDSRAPVLVKTTTCTRVLMGFEQAGRRHDVRLVPAN